MLRRTVFAASHGLASAALSLFLIVSIPAEATETAGAADQQAVEVDPVVGLIRQKLSDPSRGNVDRADREALTAFYAERSAPAIWVTAGVFSPAAHKVVSEIAKAGDWGLTAAAFDLPKPPAAEALPSVLADAEIKLWLAILKYARHARGGRVDPSQISPYLDQKPSLRDPKSIIQTIAATDAPDAYLRSLHPKHPQFERLRQVLLKARAPAQTGAASTEATTVGLPDGPNLKPGAQHPDVALLRRRLSVTTEVGRDDVYDQKLEAAVRAFQQGQGLAANGIVTGRTRAALNGAPKADARPETQQLITNMERWRWMPEDLGDFYVWDNVPEFMTRVVKKGQVIHSAKIIVGKVDTQTPIFSASMKYIVFNPEWGVPDSIKLKEILPYLRPASSDFFGFFGGTDTRVLQRHNLRVSYNGRPVDPSQVDWSRTDIRRFQFIQPAGAANVLGVVKFRFPNKHDVYMHDTPQRELFNSPLRLFSHGCIRVEDPRRLAEILLGQDKGWSAAQVGSLLAEGYNNEIELMRPIPVHVTYFTAMAGDDGAVTRFGDPYGHDSRTASALAGKPLPPPTIDAVEPGGEPIREVRRNKPRGGGTGSGTNPFSGLFGN